jgi:hypothetical protein
MPIRLLSGPVPGRDVLAKSIAQRGGKIKAGPSEKSAEFYTFFISFFSKL